MVLYPVKLDSVVKQCVLDQDVNDGKTLNKDFFFLNHTAFKLNSLWHVGYLRDNLYGF